MFFLCANSSGRYSSRRIRPVAHLR